MVKSKRTVRKKRMFTTIEMEVAIVTLFGIRENIIVPNISWGFYIHEIDLFLINKSGYVKEIEIKRSKSDLIADFTKKHHHVDKQNRINELYYAMPVELYETCKHYIPENAGIITCNRYDNDSKIYARIIRHAKKIKNSRKLTIEEQLQIARLGTMRIWSLKNKIIKLIL